MRDINLNVIPEGVTDAWCRFRLRNRQEPLSAQNISDAVILAEYFSDSIDKLQQELIDNKERMEAAIRAAREEQEGMQALLDEQAKLQALLLPPIN